MRELAEKLIEAEKPKVLLFRADPKHLTAIKFGTAIFLMTSFQTGMLSLFPLTAKYAAITPFVKQLFYGCWGLSSVITLVAANLQYRSLKTHVHLIEYDFQLDKIVVTMSHYFNYKKRKTVFVDPQNFRVSDEEIAPGCIYFDAATGKAFRTVKMGTWRNMDIFFNLTGQNPMVRASEADFGP